MTISINYIDPNKRKVQTLKIKKLNLKTHKGQFLMAYAKKFILPFNKYTTYQSNVWNYKGKTLNFKIDGNIVRQSNSSYGKNVIKLNNTVFSLNNHKHIMFQFFKNLQKLKKDHFFGAKFNHYFHRNDDPYFGTHLAKPQDYQIKSGYTDVKLNTGMKSIYGQWESKDQDNTCNLVDNIWNDQFMCWLDPKDPQDKILIDNPNGGSFQSNNKEAA